MESVQVVAVTSDRMADPWLVTQQRTHNHSTYARMDAVWFPEALKRGRKYKFSTEQMRIALAVIDKQKESK